MPAERLQTFPYVFMKPPSTTLNHPNRPIRLPKAAPDAVDWELELAVVIGKKCKRVSEADALKYVAGYTIINDISQRHYRPNPNRVKRERRTLFSIGCTASGSTRSVPVAHVSFRPMGWRTRRTSRSS